MMVPVYGFAATADAFRAPGIGIHDMDMSNDMLPLVSTCNRWF